MPALVKSQERLAEAIEEQNKINTKEVEEEVGHWTYQYLEDESIHYLAYHDSESGVMQEEYCETVEKLRKTIKNYGVVLDSLNLINLTKRIL